MQKYVIPSTSGCYDLCEKVCVALGNPEKTTEFVDKWYIRWPAGMSSSLSELIDDLNFLLTSRGIPLRWWISSEKFCSFDGISVAGMYKISKEITPAKAKLTINLGGETKTYELDPEKIETLLKSLE